MVELRSEYLEVNKKIIVFWILIVIITCIVFLAIWGSTAPSSILSVNKITIKEIHEVAKNEYRILLEYCKGVNKNALGVIVITRMEAIPIPISQNPGKIGCEVYGTKIQSDSKNGIKTNILQKDNLPDLRKELEMKRWYLKDQIISEQQKLTKEQKSQNPDLEKIESLKSNIQSLKILLKSNKASLVSLIPVA